MNDELLCYKEAYINISNQYKLLQENIKQYEYTIQQLKMENAKTQNELRDQEKIIFLKTNLSKDCKKTPKNYKLQNQISQRIEELEYRISGAPIRDNILEEEIYNKHFIKILNTKKNLHNLVYCSLQIYSKLSQIQYYLYQ